MCNSIELRNEVLKKSKLRKLRYMEWLDERPLNAAAEFLAIASKLNQLSA